MMEPMVKKNPVIDPAALSLCARFSLPPNQLGYCGRDSAPATLRSCVTTGTCVGVQEEFENFIVLYPYLKTIGQITDKDPFDYEVIEAFWFGNDLLTKCKPKHYFLLLENLQKQGVSEWLIEEMKEKKPKAFIPIHLFNIIHVGVGRASGSVAFTLGSVNNCMIRWGKVENIISQDKVEASVFSLKATKDKYHLATIKDVFSYSSDFVPGMKKGKVVAVHWGMAVKILTQDEEEKLSFWTKRFLESLG
ncbi:MAG: DUF6390 family protein [Patescibacteria group bacterium]|jgi:hypothetical protein